MVIWLLGLLALLVVVLRLSIGGVIQVRGTGVVVQLQIGPIRMTLFPRSKKQKKSSQKSSASSYKRRKTQVKKPTQPKKQRVSYSVEDWITLISRLIPVGLEAIHNLAAAFHLDRLHASLCFGGDPADAVLLYGRVSGWIGSLWEPGAELLGLKDGEVHLDVNFQQEKSVVFSGEIRFFWRLYSILTVGLGAGWKMWKVWRQMEKERKELQQADRKAA